MKIALAASIFFAGVYLGFHAEPDSELVRVADTLGAFMEQLSAR